jgi:hypothetical protein
MMPVAIFSDMLDICRFNAIILPTTNALVKKVTTKLGQLQGSGCENVNIQVYVHNTQYNYMKTTSICTN